MALEDLITRCQSHKLVSFDLFDTLVSRDCFLPHGVFYLTAWKARQNKLWVPDGYPASRIECEVRARKNSSGEEISLGNVYQELCNHYGPEKAIELKALLDLEVALEISVAYPIAPIQSVFKSLGRSKVVFTSDMYLDKEVVEAIIARATPDYTYSWLFLSSKERATKRVGTLFDRVVASTNYTPSEILHVGDHPLSDFKSPRKRGLSAWQLTWTKSSDHEAYLYDVVGRRLGSGESQRLFLELFVGAMKKARLSHLGTQPADAEGRFRLGYEIVGPILFSYVYWVLRTAASDSVRKLYFVARDGQILLQIARKIMLRMGLDLDLRYLHGSRQAWNLPGLLTVNESGLSWILQKLPHITLTIISKRLEIDDDLLQRAYREKFGEEITKSDILNDAQTANVRALLLSGRLNKEILSSAADARSRLVNYLKKESVLSYPEVAIVDLGWQGRLQDALLRVLQSQGHYRITGYYFGLLSDASQDNNTKKAFFFDQMQLKARTSVGRPFINLSEIFCAADHGTTLGYRASAPVLKEPVNNAAAGWGLSDMRAGVSHFIDSIPSDLFDSSLLRSEFSREVVSASIEKLTKTPTCEQAKLLGSYVFSGDQLEEYLREFAPPLSLSDAMLYLASDDYPTRSRFTLWLEASLLRSSAAIQSMFVQYGDKLKWHDDPALSSQLPSLLAKPVIKYSKLCDEQTCETVPALHTLCVNRNLRKVVQHPDFGDIDALCLKGAYDLAIGVPPPPVAVVGHFDRAQQAHYDETDCIAQLFNTALTGKVMIDVGAHHGYAHAPFLDRQWQIFAFEPDQSNRAKLLERLAKHKHRALVTLDTRCVSNQSQTGVSFFTSEQSTGISGLSAFHATHKESQKVDITTLTEFFQDRPLPAIDFLKIDTEGHDLFVLQGYPWERGQPAVIECEFEDTKTVPLGYTFHDLARYLGDKGYRVYVSEWHPIIRYGIRHDWRALMRYPCELSDPKGWGNLLAFCDPIDEQALVAAVKKVLKLGTPAPKQAPTSAPLPTAPVPIGPPSFRVEPGPHYAPIAANQWRYTHSEAKQRLWVATLAQPIGPGQAVTGGLRIQADRAMTVNVTLGRHGSTTYEGTTQRLQLVSGQAQAVTLTKTFKQPHVALKLQVEVVTLPDGGSATLTITDLHLIETPESLSRRLGVTTITLTEANRRLRTGDFATALPMYLWLHDQHPMRIYADNARFAARKLGLTLTPSTNLDDLCKRLTSQRSQE
jgi:FkbM family methyltransferase